jgi:hypothetical protein
MGITNQREPVGGNAGLTIPQWHLRRDGLDRSSESSGIDQLTAQQPLRIGSPLGDDFTVHDRNEVGRGRSYVDEDARRDRPSDERGRSVPVGSTHQKGLPPRVGGRQKAAVNGVHPKLGAGKAALERIQDVFDALAFRVERLR